MDYKYELNQDRTALVLKEGKTGRFGGVEFLIDHDTLYGTGDYKDIKVCLLHYMGINPNGVYIKLPPFFRKFGVQNGQLRQESVDHCSIQHTENLLRASTHCREAKEELIQLIELTKYHERKNEIVRKIAPCSSRLCLVELVKSRVTLV